jgi:hypothetical protein
VAPHSRRFNEASRIRNERPDSRVIEQMATVLGRRAGTVWLLIDTALLDRDAWIRWLLRSGFPHDNAFQGSRLAAYGDHAPRLIRLDAGAANKATLASLARLTASAPAVSFIQPQLATDLGHIQRVLAYLAMVKIEQREKAVHCRVADTRVLPQLLSALDPSQLAPVADAIANWRWYGRRNSVEERCLERPATPLTPPSALHLTINQFRLVQRAAEADGVYLLLRERVPELVPRSDPGRFHARLQDYLDQASEYALTGAEDRLQFVVLSLSCGDSFHRHPSLAPAWRAVRAGSTLVGQMRLWDEASWAALQSGRAAPA